MPLDGCHNTGFALRRNDRQRRGRALFSLGCWLSYSLAKHVLPRLQVLHKAPIREAKQVEHVLNERRTQAAAGHPLCVALLAAFQDTHCLYLLQEFVPGACPAPTFASTKGIWSPVSCRCGARLCQTRLCRGMQPF